MYISELTGYKNNPIYQKARSTYDLDYSQYDDLMTGPRLLKQSNLRKLANLEFAHYLRKEGFKPLAKPGQGGLAFVKPGYEWVFKIFTHDPAYMNYIKYARANQRNPHVPKFKGSIMKINDQTFAIRMEHLEPGKSNAHKAVVNELKNISFLRTYVQKSKEDAFPFTKKHFKGIHKIVDDLFHIMPNMKLDITPENIMERTDGTLVVTDPVFLYQ